MSTISLDVDIEQFDDEEVLNRALKIIHAERFNGRELELLSKIKRELNSEDESLPPPSTAAKVHYFCEIEAISRKAQGIGQ
jgi:hypothetical protein